MKKALSIAVTSILALSLLAGCGNKQTKETSSSAYKDGKYKAAYDKLDSHGWKAFVEVEIKDGKIATVDFDYLNKDNKRKSEDAEYTKAMKPKSGTSPDEFCPKLEKALVEKQDVDKVDGVTGATQSTANFKTLSKAALENAKKGDTKEVIVPLPEEEKKATTSTYKDGKYKAAYDKLDSHGWKAFVEVEIKDGKIATVDFDYLNKDNKRKSEDKEYTKAMKPKSGTSPDEFCPKLEKALVEKQDVDKVDGVTGATQSTANFKTLSKAALENAKKGDTKEVIVPLKE